AYLLRPFAPAELLAQVQTFLRLKDRHDHLADKTAEVNRVNKRLHAAYQQIDQELELARRIQESFLPQSLPQVPETRFAVTTSPAAAWAAISTTSSGSTRTTSASTSPTPWATACPPACSPSSSRKVCGRRRSTARLIAWCRPARCSNVSIRT